MNTLEKTEDACAAADFVCRCLMHVHRGVFDCGDKIVVYGNDGYGSDERSQREVELVIEGLTDMALNEPEFGTDAEGCSWALLVRNYQRRELPLDAINNIVWDSWIKACDEKHKSAVSVS